MKVETFVKGFLISLRIPCIFSQKQKKKKKKKKKKKNKTLINVTRLPKAYNNFCKLSLTLLSTTFPIRSHLTIIIICLTSEGNKSTRLNFVHGVKECVATLILKLFINRQNFSNGATSGKIVLSYHITHEIY